MTSLVCQFWQWYCLSLVVIIIVTVDYIGRRESTIVKLKVIALLIEQCRLHWYKWYWRWSAKPKMPLMVTLRSTRRRWMVLFIAAPKNASLYFSYFSFIFYSYLFGSSRRPWMVALIAAYLGCLSDCASLCLCQQDSNATSQVTLHIKLHATLLTLLLW